MIKPPRIALFADTFNEINGAANTLRRLTAFAKERGYPFLCIHSGTETLFSEEENYKSLQLKRSRLSVKLDSELKYDPFLWRHKKLVQKTIENFKPQVLHLTGISDVSQIGYYFAHFRQLPAVASWHTNAHEYAARRGIRNLALLPVGLQEKFGKLIEKTVLRGAMKIHFLAQMQLAPNEELVRLMREMTRRPSFLMSRGVDTEFFNPSKRARKDDVFVIGYVGRLRVEKNVRLLCKLDNFLRENGLTDYKFLIVGDGNEEDYLRGHLKRADFTGVLRGENLADAFASMDLFAFPSRTDAFGNVVLEAMAAGVPSVVMPEGGPKFLIEHEKNGFVARSEQNFCEITSRLVANKQSLEKAKIAARNSALSHSWEKIFDDVFDKYRLAVTLKKNVRADDFYTTGI